MPFQASDRDSLSDIRYEITGGNTQSLFAIDAMSGVITTTRRKLDRESDARHTLEVRYQNPEHFQLSEGVSNGMAACRVLNSIKTGTQSVRRKAPLWWLADIDNVPGSMSQEAKVDQYLVFLFLGIRGPGYCACLQSSLLWSNCGFSRLTKSEI